MQNAVQQWFTWANLSKKYCHSYRRLAKKRKVCSILMPRFMSRKARISTLHFRLIFLDSLIGQEPKTTLLEFKWKNNLLANCCVPNVTTGHVPTPLPGIQLALSSGRSPAALFRSPAITKTDFRARSLKSLDTQLSRPPNKPKRLVILQISVYHVNLKKLWVDYIANVLIHRWNSQLSKIGGR